MTLARVALGLWLVGGAALIGLNLDAAPGPKTKKPAKPKSHAVSKSVKKPIKKPRAAAPKAKEKPLEKKLDKPVDWSVHARRFTGESERVRDRSIEALRKEPNLKARLEEALGTPKHFLALDVIVALELKDMAPVLLRFSEEDETGYSYHALNAILTPQNQRDVLKAYRERLEAQRKPGGRKLSPAAQVALIDAMTRAGLDLDPGLVEAFLTDVEPEVRSSGLYYVRMALLKKRRYDGLKLLAVALADPAFQIRMQALYVVSELSDAARGRRAIQDALRNCAKEDFEEARVFCDSLKNKRRGGGT